MQLPVRPRKFPDKVRNIPDLVRPHNSPTPRGTLRNPIFVAFTWAARRLNNCCTAGASMSATECTVDRKGRPHQLSKQHKGIAKKASYSSRRASTAMSGVASNLATESAGLEGTTSTTRPAQVFQNLVREISEFATSEPLRNQGRAWLRSKPE
jgi:hypothetical protein